MALLDLYIQTTGSNLNAGTDNGSNPTPIPSVTCTVSTGTITFTGASGAFTGVAVGAWVSLYNSADTIARFVGQVATNDNTTITVLYASGTGYSTTGLGLATGLTSGGGAGAVLCRVGGAWAGFGITGTNGCMNGTVPSLSGAMTSATYNGLRVNIKAGTYAYAAAVTLPTALTAKPIWYRGYYSTIGDIDECANINGTLTAPAGATAAPSGATRPQITFSTTSGNNITSGAYSWFENLEFTNPTNTTGISPTTFLRVHRCRFTGGTCIYGFVHATGCLFAPASNGAANSFGMYIGNVFRGGNPALTLLTNYFVAFNLFDSCTVGLALYSGGSSNIVVINNTFYNCGTGITTGNNSSYQFVANNIFSNCTSYGINNAMTNSWQLALHNNAFYSNTSGNVSSVFESTQRGLTLESSSPFVSPGASHDYTLVSGAASRQAGFPGQLEV
jgi:hypothetical protein